MADTAPSLEHADFRRRAIAHVAGQKIEVGGQLLGAAVTNRKGEALAAMRRVAPHRLHPARP